MKERSRVEQFEGIRRDRRDAGLSIRQLAAKHQVHRRTVRAALADAVPPPRKTPEREAVAFGPYGHARRVLPRWVGEYIERRRAESDAIA